MLPRGAVMEKTTSCRNDFNCIIKIIVVYATSNKEMAMQIKVENGINEFKALGFTHLEAEIYLHLLGAKASSGYAISQAIAKPTANVYKAINTLEKKGAILVDEGDTRLCIPVPATELLNALQHSFMTQKERASQFLSQIQTTESSDKVYRLKQPEQVFEKCRNMLRQSKEMVLVDAFGPALDPIMEDLIAATKRGVKIALHGYESIDIPGVRVFNNSAGQTIHQKWSGQWINIIVDSRAFVMAYLSKDLSGVYQAVWSNSQYISWVYHSALLAEQQLSELKTRLNDESDIEVVREMVADMDHFFNLKVPGYFDLLDKFNENEEQS